MKQVGHLMILGVAKVLANWSRMGRFIKRAKFRDFWRLNGAEFW